MKKDNKSAALILRQKAEEELVSKFYLPGEETYNADNQHLIHELQVHQVELKMQNDELLRAKEESELVRQKYADLYDFAPSGYFTLNHEGEIVELNLCASGMVGKERSLLINSRLGFFISDDTRTYFNNFLHNIFKYEGKEYCEVTFTGNENGPMYVQMNGTLAENKKHCLLTAVDITKRKLAEDIVIESEHFLKEIQFITMHGSFSIDIEHHKWEGSEVLNLILGIDNSFDHSLKAWMSLVHPDWLEPMRNYFYETVASRNRFDKEYKIIRQNDQQERWVHVVGQIEFDENNNPVRLKGALGDITEQKLTEVALRASEEKYRMLIELASDAFFHGDSKGNFITVNSIAEEYTGYSKEELLKMNMKDLFSENTLKSAPLKYEQARKGEIVSTEREVIRKDGRTLIVDMKSKMMPDKTFQSFFRDITERKRVEGALNKKLHEMEIYYELAITRERKMIALKSEINNLLTRLGESLKY